MFHVCQGAKTEAVFSYAGDAEIIGLGTRGQHQAAEGQAAAAGGMHLGRLGVDAHNPVLQPGHPFAGQQTVVAGCDFPAAQFAAQQFVEQGQK